MSADDAFLGDDEIEIIEVVGLDEDAPPGEVADEARSPVGEPVGDEDGEERFLRLQADFENFRKRVERDRDDYERHAHASLVERLLPTLDNLERALSLEAPSEVYDPFRDGISLIYRELLEQLRRAGLEPLESVGRPFDPNLHEAIATEPSHDVDPHTVLEEVQRGYRFVDRLLRPARVKVSVEPGDPALAGEHEEPSHG